MNRYNSIMRRLRSIPKTRLGEGGKYEMLPLHLSEEDLLAAERHLGESLPADYREFMRDFGGFILPADARFKLPDSEVRRWGSIEDFSTILPQGTEASSLLSYYQSICHASPAWPEECLPIGTNAGSGVIGLAFKGKNKGAVYMMFEHADVCFVAPTFDEFLHLIRNFDDGEDAEELAEEFWKPYLGELSG